MRRRSNLQRSRIRDIISEISKEESCAADQALMIFSLRVVLAAMTRIGSRCDHLILKGGTALRLAIGRPIGRVSLDLDLSLKRAGMHFDHVLFLEEIPREITAILSESFMDAATIRISLHEDRTETPYPEQPKLLRFRLVAEADTGNRSLLRGDNRGFIVELAIDEYVDVDQITPLSTTISGLPIHVQMYSPVQAMAEKLRALLQKLQYYERNGNEGSFQPRHVFDLQHLYEMLQPGDLERLKDLFARKCDARMVPLGQRTRARLLHPLLKAKVEAEALRTRLPLHGWARLEELAQLVCDE